jgi:hypothetical protein
MLAGSNVITGKYYVNQARDIAREVVETHENVVIFITFHPDTGRSSGTTSECIKQHFTHGADHEATLAEMSNIRQHKMYTL